MTPGEEAEMRAILADRYAEGYKAGRIAALREVGCQYGCARYADKRNYCSRCRLLAEAESGE